LKIRTREVRADIAFGGAFYAIVDSESAGVPMDGAHLPELRRAGADIVRAVEAVLTAVHPATPQLRGIDGAILTGPRHRPGSDLRCVSVSAAGVVARGASGTGSAAILSVLDAIGLTTVDAALVCEGIAGTQLAARITERTTVGDYNALLTEVEGSAWITGEHTFALDDADPLVDGFLLS
jgi:proline racemase